MEQKRITAKEARNNVEEYIIEANKRHLEAVECFIDRFFAMIEDRSKQGLRVCRFRIPMDIMDKFHESSSTLEHILSSLKEQGFTTYYEEIKYADDSVCELFVEW